MALYEWRLTPEYLNEHWTEELLYLMLKARNERRSVKASAPQKSGEPEVVDTQTFLQNVNGFGGGGFGYFKG